MSQRRLRLPARKYHSKSDGPRVRIFCSFTFSIISSVWQSLTHGLLRKVDCFFSLDMLVSCSLYSALTACKNTTCWVSISVQVPFFSDDEEASTTPKADAFIIPRENPRALVVRPVEQWPSRSMTDKQFGLKMTPTSANENGKIWFCVAYVIACMHLTLNIVT